MKPYKQQSTRALKKKIDLKISHILQIINEAPRPYSYTPRSYREQSIQTSFLQEFNSMVPATTRMDKTKKLAATRFNTEQSNRSHELYFKADNEQAQKPHLITEWDEKIEKEEDRTNLSLELRQNMTIQLPNAESNQVKKRDALVPPGSGSRSKRQRKSSIVIPCIPNRQKSSKNLLETMRNESQNLYKKNRQEDGNYNPRDLLIKRLNTKYQKQKHLADKK